LKTGFRGGAATATIEEKKDEILTEVHSPKKHKSPKKKHKKTTSGIAKINGTHCLFLHYWVMLLHGFLLFILENVEINIEISKMF
jgi:hypothetical protein